MKKPIRSLVAFGFFLSLFSGLNSPLSHAILATNYDAQQVSVQIAAREGGNAEISVTTWLPNAETSTADTVFVRGNYSNSPVLAVSNSPTIINDNGQSYANYRLNVPESLLMTNSWFNSNTFTGPNGVSESVTYATLIVYVSSIIHPTVGTDGATISASVSANPCWSNYFQPYFYGAPISASFTPTASDPFTQSLSGASAYKVSLYDAAGQPTLMLPGQSLTLSPTSNISLQRSPTSQSFASVGQSATVASTDLNSQLTYSIQGTRSVSLASVLGISTSNNWASLTPTTFTIAASTAALTQPRMSIGTLSRWGYNTYGLASGSNGQLYIWGGATSAASTAQQTTVTLGGPGNIFPQPVPVQIPSGCLVKQIISGVVLDSCGYLWNLSLKFDSPGASVGLILYTTAAPILQISDGGAYGLMSDSTVRNLSTNVPVDLTLLGTESATAVNYSSSSGTLYILTSRGHLFSDFGNGSGAAGRGTTAASVGLGLVNFSGEPDTATVTSLATSSNNGSVAATLSDGTLWGWGNNAGGYAGKDPTQITQLNSPALIPLPVGIVPTKVTSEFSQSNYGLLLYGRNQSSQPTIWTFGAGNFTTLSPAPSGNQWVEFIDSANGVDSAGGVFSSINGNCSDPAGNNRVASTGQFGPAYSYDSLITSNIFVQEGLQSSVVVGGVVNEVAGHTFSLQFSGVHTKCYTSTSQLNVAWDLTGNGSYTTSAAISTASTGYSVYQTTLTYPSAGRYKVGLQVTTPSGNVYASVVTVGIDAATSSSVSLSDTRTVTIASNSDHTLAIGSDGKIYAWGQNNCEQLGISNGTYQTLNVPSLVSISDSSTITSVSVGYATSYAINALGKVYAWGSSPGPNGGNSGLLPTQISELSSTFVLDIAAGLGSSVACQYGSGSDVAQDVANRYSGPNYGVVVAMTSGGKLVQWSHTAGVSAVPGSAGLIFRQILSSSGELYALDSAGNVWTWQPTANTALTQVTTIAGVSKIRAGYNVVVAISSDGGLRAEVNNGLFGVVSVPLNTVFADAQAFYQGGVVGITTTGNIYSSQLSYATVGGVNSLTNSTWVPIQQNVSIDSSDLAATQPKSDQFLTFGSNRLFSYSYSGYQGNCGLGGYVDSQGRYVNLNRVISQGQFGDAYNPDTIRVGSLTATVGSGTATAVSQGGLIAATSGTSVVIRAQNISSQCYATNLTISADSSGTGRFTTVPLSNEGGTLNYVIPTTIPSSGRSTVTIRAQAVSGLTLSFAINLASFSTTPSSNITNRTQPFITAQNFGLAVGSDGNAYGWANDKAFNFLINSAPPFSSYSPTRVILPSDVHVADLGAASSGSDFGMLVLDTLGRTWTWGTSANANLPITTFSSGSTPTAPTLVPGLIGKNIKRLAVSNEGDSTGAAMAALSNTGVVYVWNSVYRTPVPVNALAGLDIVDIRIDFRTLYALTSSGDLYTSYSGLQGWTLAQYPNACNGDWPSIAAQNLSDSSQACLLIQKVILPDPVKNFSNYTGYSSGVAGTLLVTTTGKLYFFGSDMWAQAQLPRLIAMPNNLSASFAGGLSPGGLKTSKGQTLPQIIASNGTWFSLVAQPDASLTLVPTDEFIPNVESLVPGISGFSDGDGFGVRTSGGQLYTVAMLSVPGSCLVDSPTFNRVMSDGQFGPAYHTDQIDISASGPTLFRPGVATSIYLTATSVCNGGIGITFDHQILGESGYSGKTDGTVSYDRTSATAVYNFTASGNGVNWITFRATTASGVSQTYQFEADISPAPPSGLLGISINNGDRYTNSRNVTINMVWPDGALVAYVSNDGGFVPGTFAMEPLVSRIPWVLPPQAAVPLPALVYARFGDSNALTYFDDIIMDSSPPILTFASATPTP